MNTPQEFRHVKEALSGQVVCIIGQVSKEERKELDRLARKGTIEKWRGYWFPVSGGTWGIGPLKTCYGTSLAKALAGG